MESDDAEIEVNWTIGYLNEKPKTAWVTMVSKNGYGAELSAPLQINLTLKEAFRMLREWEQQW